MIKWLLDVDLPRGWDPSEDLPDRVLQARGQVRCSFCGRFAKVIRFSPGFFGDDPSWDVDCKRCGDHSGMIGDGSEF